MSHPVRSRILIVEDDSQIRKFLRAGLEASGYELDQAETGQAAVAQAALKAPDVVEGLAKNSLQPLTQSPEEFAAMVKADLARWAPIVKATGFTAED